MLIIPYARKAVSTAHNLVMLEHQDHNEDNCNQQGMRSICSIIAPQHVPTMSHTNARKADEVPCCLQNLDAPFCLQA